MALDLLIVYGSVRTDRQGIKAARFMLQTCLARGHQATSDRSRRRPATTAGPDVQGIPARSGSGGSRADWPARSRRPTPSSSSRASTTTAFPRRSRTFWTTFWRSISGVLRPSFATRAEPSAASARRCNLRAMLCELGTPSIPSLLPVPKVQDAFDDDGRPRDEAWNRRADRFLRELEWYAQALKEARKSGVPY